MKKGISVLCVLLALVMLCLPVASAAQVESEPLGKVYAVVTDENGKTVKTAAPDAEELNGVAEYELYIEKEPVLAVGSTAGESTGVTIPLYFNVKFMIPGTADEVYLTGLRGSYVEEIQQAIIDNYVYGENFDIESLGFIDTEKTMKEDNDDSLCWAASDADILQYTGWGAKAGFKSEDELFDLYAKSFTNNGGHQHNGLAWFFNGVALGGNSGLMGAKIINYQKSGGYLKSYAYDMVCNYEYIENVNDLNRLSKRLQSGYGISLGILLYDSHNNSGGHAISMWGTVIDTSLAETDPKRYKSIFITDSDSHMAEGTDRRSAQNVMSLYNIDSSSGRFTFNYYDDVTAVLDDYTYLVPYSKKVPVETDLTTYRDKTRYPDLAVILPYISDTDATDVQKELYESGANVNFGCSIGSTADKRYFSNVVLDVKVTDQTGKSLYSNSSSNFLNLSYTEMTTLLAYNINSVPAGDYTLKFTINPKHDVTEAYYYNNTYTFGFKVRDSYLLGDFNGDGVVNIQDATALQRRLAEFSSKTDAKADERGNVNGNKLNISDVTAMQRWLANVPTGNAIGEKQLHTVI